MRFAAGVFRLLVAHCGFSASFGFHGSFAGHLPKARRLRAGLLSCTPHVDGEGRESSRVLEMPRESARMWQMQSRILVRAEFCACGQWHRGESAEFTHRPQSSEIRANSRI